MPNTIRVVLDLNLLVSALIGRPAIRALLEHWRNQHLTLILSERLLSELFAVLHRPKFSNYFVEDDILLEVAATARAQYLGTGDQDLLDDPALIATMRDQYGVQVARKS